jgi:hypothetical protein
MAFFMLVILIGHAKRSFLSDLTRTIVFLSHDYTVCVLDLNSRKLLSNLASQIQGYDKIKRH